MTIDHPLLSIPPPPVYPQTTPCFSPPPAPPTYIPLPLPFFTNSNLLSLPLYNPTIPTPFPLNHPLFYLSTLSLSPCLPTIFSLPLLKSTPRLPFFHLPLLLTTIISPTPQPPPPISLSSSSLPLFPLPPSLPRQRSSSPPSLNITLPQVCLSTRSLPRRSLPYQLRGIGVYTRTPIMVIEGGGGVETSREEA